MDKIIGLGNALVDVLATLDSDEILTEMELPKGSMTLIDEDKLLKINKYFSRMKTHQATGGSAGNAIRAMAQLGAGTGFIGKVNNDSYGRFFGESLLKHGTEANLLVSDTLPSGVASTFISPDGERTFGTYLGAASTLKAEELSLEMFKGYTYLFIEGYLVQEHDMILRAIELAKEAGLQVCLDMASYNIVAGDHEFFSLLVNKYVDIVFANEEEAKAFTGKEPEEALDIIAKMCSIAIVKVGARGFGYDNQRNRGTFELALKGGDEFNRGMPVKIKQQDIGRHFLIIQAELVQIIRVEQKISHFFEILVVKFFVDGVVIVQENVAQVLHIVSSFCCCFCVKMPEYLLAF